MSCSNFSKLSNVLSSSGKKKYADEVMQKSKAIIMKNQKTIAQTLNNPPLSYMLM